MTSSSARKGSTQFSAKILATNGILVALYIILATFIAIRFGNIRITLGSLPVVLAAMLYGPTIASIVGTCGELGVQLLTYGLSYTTPLWLIPSAARGVLLGLAFRYGWATGRKFYAANILVAIVVTLLNTLVIYLDSVILGYFSWVYVFSSFAIRIISGIITAIAVSTVAIIIQRRLKGKGL